jgi:hypothetical protein
VVLIGLLIVACFAWATDRYSQPGPIHLDRDREKWVRHTLSKMSTEEKVGGSRRRGEVASFVMAMEDSWIVFTRADTTFSQSLPSSSHGICLVRDPAHCRAY